MCFELDRHGFEYDLYMTIVSDTIEIELRHANLRLPTPYFYVEREHLIEFRDWINQKVKEILHE